MAPAAPDRSLSDTAAFLESLFAASTSSRPVVDVEGSYEVRFPAQLLHVSSMCR
jgi:hypothetical protein